MASADHSPSISFTAPLLVAPCACNDQPENRPRRCSALAETTALAFVAFLLLCVPPPVKQEEDLNTARFAFLTRHESGVRTLELQNRKKLWIIDDALPEDFVELWRAYLEDDGPDDNKVFAEDNNTDFSDGREKQENRIVEHWPVDEDSAVHPLAVQYTRQVVAKAEEVTGLSLMRGRRVEQIYTNLLNKGNRGLVHTDEIRQGHYSVLLFCHKEWHANLGGELVIFDLPPHYAADDNKLLERVLDHSGTEAQQAQFEIDLGATDIHAIMPRPNRLVVFPSEIPHSARPPQVHVKKPRLSTALRLVDMDALDEGVDDDYGFFFEGEGSAK